jgi:hypothetical protein
MQDLVHGALLEPTDLVLPYGSCFAPMHCSTDEGKVHSPLLSVAGQNRLTEGLCYASTFKNLLHTGVQWLTTNAL